MSEYKKVFKYYRTDSISMNVILFLDILLINEHFVNARVKTIINDDIKPFISKKDN